jgi:precorrin-6Y C5,15-methyltransferase (decarboxylating)
MEIVEGRAPQALRDLPAPTHVFIGGSGGEISEIIDLALSKNPEAKFVVNCITSETLAELQTALKNPVVCELKCTQVIVNREEMLGRYHYLRAGNPVFIISFTGAGDR